MTSKPTTLITGGAKRIGAEIAQHLAAAGHDLVLHYHRSEVEAKALAAMLTAQHGTTVTLVQADLADSAALAHFWRGLPLVTHVIHNASSFAREPFGQFTATQLRAYLAINLEAPLLLSQSFLAQLPADTRGTITVLGDSAFGWSIGPNFFPYAVSKHAWNSIIELLATATAPRARANLLALGPTLSGAIDNEAMFARLAQDAPLQRTGAPAEVCTAIDFLLASPGVTGQVISLANGMHLRS